MFLFNIDIFILVLFLFAFASSDLIKSAANKYFSHHDENKETMLIYMKITKMFISVLLICIFVAFFPLPSKLNFLNAFIFDYNGLRNLKIAVYGFSALSLAILFYEQKASLYKKRNLINFSDYTHSPFPFIFAAAGGIIALSSRNLVFLLIGLETLSWSVFYLFYQTKKFPSSCEQTKNIQASSEQTPKVETLKKHENDITKGSENADFFMLKISYFSSTLFLIAGIGLLGAKYGFCFSTVKIANEHDLSWISYLSFIFIICAFFLKTAIVPFHFWLNRIYEKARNSACCLFTCVAVPIFIYIFALLCSFIFPSYMTGTEPIFIAISLLSVLCPAISIRSCNLKQFATAISTVNSGLCLSIFPCLISASTPSALNTLLFFLIPQTLAFAGFFAVLNIISNGKDNTEQFKGIARQIPFLSFSMIVFIFCLIGAPPFINFLGRINIISLLQFSGYNISAVFLIVSTVLMFMHAFTIIRIIYQDPADSNDIETPLIKVNPIILFCFCFLIFLSIFVDAFSTFCLSTVSGIFS